MVSTNRVDASGLDVRGGVCAVVGIGTVYMILEC